MTDWQPATEVEAAMRDALLRQDQERYFQLLAGTELLLPVSAEALAGQVPMGWGTWTTNGRTHVLAFTSPVTLHACLGNNGSSARRVTFAELANTWPNLEWWLAVNPGLPIEGWLPAWFVAQLARGDARLPTRGSQARARATATVPTGHGGGPQSAAGRPGAPTEGYGGDPYGTGRPDFDQPEPEYPAPAPPLAAPTVPAPQGQWPHPDRADADAAVTHAATPAPRGAPPYGSTQSQTSTVGGLAPSGLPRRVPTPAPGTAADAAPAGAPDVAPAPSMPAAPSSPAPPAAPVAAADQAAQGQAAPGQATPPEPAEAEVVAEVTFEPANDVEHDLVTAAGGGGSNSFLSTLLLARVLLPVAASSSDGARPGDDGFVWRTETVDDDTFVLVFTSPERIADHFDAPVETVEVKFVQLIRRWPDPQWSFVINPGTPVGAKLPGTEIVGLASWAAEVGLGAEPDVEPAEPKPSVTATPTPKTAAQRPDPDQPTMMQKAIAPSQLDYYLERGYDRVSGFVHRAGEVAHLGTASKLHTALGLGYAGSPFDPTAAEVFVLRWRAYRPHLYRIPYGGQNEAAMRAMEGWVIERTPFRGNGFAPGESSDVVAEFKVDSIRLPHGSQLWRITDGSETLVAQLDADESAWHRVKED
ncbi:SseB family protein [Micromonospora sp. NBC_01813]|uniref:SseB family protein n=1 Tax=Micromonospora sp. NBC_01813 TaxID=2975988 RepID=UPI002DD7CC82|nr:SseB family protein [Micromonospora sp. NBC_01813]WSA07903.1 SseB family protein [Micromonospora sp. NBC_01813]